jgi:hypothetical protein
VSFVVGRFGKKVGCLAIRCRGTLFIRSAASIVFSSRLGRRRRPGTESRANSSLCSDGGELGLPTERGPALLPVRMVSVPVVPVVAVR